MATRLRPVRSVIREHLESIPDPYERIREAWKLRDDTRRIAGQVVRKTVRDLREKRLTQEEIALELGISKQRVGQLEFESMG
jgi:DNA-directed RNA polymerase specialized sigma subunit